MARRSSFPICPACKGKHDPRWTVREKHLIVCYRENPEMAKDQGESHGSMDENRKLLEEIGQLLDRLYVQDRQLGKRITAIAVCGGPRR